MSHAYENELQLIESVCQESASSGKLTDRQRAKLADLFGERFKNAMQLVDDRKVHRFRFKPSGRMIWTVKGRKAVYQVISETNFCNCDDYYFRVMDGKKALCYHVIAQKLSAALGRFGTSELRDRQYAAITEQWRTRPEPTP